MQIAAHQQIEHLVGAAELDVGSYGHRIVCLEQRVEKLGDGYGVVLREAAGEVVALEELGHGKLAGQSYHVGQAERPEPVALPSDFSAVAVHYLEELRQVGLGVFDDLLVGKHGPRGGASGRIAYLRRPVSHDDNDRMPKVLQLP